MNRVYVKSDFELLPLIPENWQIHKNKWIYNKQKEIVGDQHPNYQLLSLTKNGIKEISIDDATGKKPGDYGTYQVVNEGDLILCLYDLDVSAVFVGFSNYNGIISPSYLNLESTEMIHNKYSYYWFLMNFFNRRYKIYSKSIRYTINNDNFMSLESPVPPFQEQTAIANFLDEKTAKIDELIQVQETAIEKLEEYKQSVITEAVTKGLDPNVEMINSGIDWIGEIPTNWDIRKGKDLFSMHGSNFKIDPDGLEMNLVRVDHMNNFYGIFNLVNDFDVVRSTSTPLKGKKILIPKRGGAIYTNKVRITNEDIHLDPNIMALKLKLQQESLEYFAFQILCRKLDEIGDVSTIPQINNKHIRVLELVKPSIEEQKSIVAFLERETRQINQLIECKRDKILKLNEYRQSLIYEAVTGKLEVM